MNCDTMKWEPTSDDEISIIEPEFEKHYVKPEIASACDAVPSLYSSQPPGAPTSQEYLLQNEIKQDPNSTTSPSSSRACSSMAQSLIFTPLQSAKENVQNNAMNHKSRTAASAVNRSRPKQTASSRRKLKKSSSSTTIIGTESEQMELINQVRKHSLLYDKRSAHHRNVKRTDRAWAAIGRELRISAARCVQRWRAICGKLSVTKKQVGKGPLTQKSIEYMRSLSFLPSMKQTMKCFPAEISVISSSSELSDNRNIEPSTSNHLSGSGSSVAAVRPNNSEVNTSVVPSNDRSLDQQVADDIARALQVFSHPAKMGVIGEIYTIIADAKRKITPTHDSV